MGVLFLQNLDIYITLRDFDKIIYTCMRCINEELGIEMKMIDSYDKFSPVYNYYWATLSEAIDWSIPHISAGCKITIHIDNKEIIDFIMKLNHDYSVDNICSVSNSLKMEDLISVISSIFFKIPGNIEFDDVISFIYEDVYDDDLPNNPDIFMSKKVSIIKNQSYIGKYRAMLVRANFEDMAKEFISNCDYKDCVECNRNCFASICSKVIKDIDSGRDIYEILKELEGEKK